MILDKDAIRAADDLPRKLIEVPEWGGSVYVRSLSASDADSLEFVKGAHLRATLAVMAVCDADGKLLFTKADTAWLASKSAKALARIVDAVKEMSSFTDKEISELEGKSEAATG
jgi:hypothetical protein